jgi:SAM-dependent methyltransferase
LVIDLGAGTGHLTTPLAERGCNVVALEPNQKMRRHGIARTRHFANVRWIVGRMERTMLPAGHFSLATCGSSFGVADHDATLREVARILEPAGWFACMWNYRDLDEPLQRDIEAFIKASIPDYQYGSRRADQAAIIAGSGLFATVQVVEARIVHRLPKSAWMDAWRSHATLQRQAGPQFARILAGIAAIVGETDGDELSVPYTTRVWIARRNMLVAPAGA